MNLANKIIDWIRYKKEHEYEEPIPLLIYIGGALNRIRIILHLTLLVMLIPIFVYEPFSSNYWLSIIYRIGFVPVLIFSLLDLIEPWISQWLSSWPKHHAKHFLAVGISLIIITIPLAWYYYYRKENVVKYFNQFKE